MYMTKQETIENNRRCARLYYQKIKEEGGERYAEMVRRTKESAKRYYNRKYATNADFRKLVSDCNKRYRYYKADNVLKDVKLLYGDHLFYGR